ncbi:hypothetical protein AAFF_G00057420, partial [Aldrovandia affinis]
MSRPREEEGLKAAELKTRDDVTDAEIKRVQLERAGSPVPSCLSVKSDWSMDNPFDFRGGRYPPDESGVWPGGVACDICTERKVRAVKFCVTCAASYCEKHIRSQYTVPALQRHTLQEATGDLQYRLCQQHHRPVKLFCNTDQTPSCSQCSVQTHRGHDVDREGTKQSGTQ